MQYNWLADNSSTAEGVAFFFDQARLWRSRALVANPEAEPETWYGLGRAAARQGNHGLAIEAYTRFVAFAPTNFNTYLRRGNAFAALGQLDDNQSFKIGERPLLNRHQQDSQRGYYTRAVSDFSKAIEINPASAIAHNHRGMAHAVIGDETSAIADYSRAIDLDPENIEAYRNRSRSYARVGDQSKSDADAAKAVALRLFAPVISTESNKP